MRRRQRSAFTLLEVLLSMSIAVVLLAAVYAVVGYQLRYAQAGREVIEGATLSRSLFTRMNSDISMAIGLSDACRFRRQQQGGDAGAAGDAAADPAAGGSTPTGGGSTPAAGGSTPTSTSKTGTGGMSGGTTPAPAAASSSSMSSMAMGGGMGSVQLPLGVIGNASELHLYMSRVPGEVFSPQPEELGGITCDLRRVSYWLASEGEGGLCRMEVRLVTSDDGVAPSVPSDSEKYLMAPEVKSLEFSYFDGSEWTSSWDSTAAGPDGVTPIGSPRAIRITMGVVPPGKTGNAEQELKYYRHVVAVPTANGTQTQDNTEGGTTKP